MRRRSFRGRRSFSRGRVSRYRVRRVGRGRAGRIGWRM